MAKKCKCGICGKEFKSLSARREHKKKGHSKDLIKSGEVKQMEKTIGIVTKTSYKADKNSYGIEIGQGNWYNGFGQPGCKKGDKIEIEYEQNGQWKNAGKVTVLEQKVESTNTTQYGRDPETIVRTDCFRMAVDLHIADNQIDIKETAELLYNQIMKLD